MTSAALFERSSTLGSAIFPRAYEAFDEHASVSESSQYQYAKCLGGIFAGSQNGGFRQRAHITAGQVVTILATNHEFPTIAAFISPGRSGTGSLPDWIARVLEFCRSDRQEAALKEIALFTSRAKADQDFERLSRDLCRFQLGNLPDVVLVSLLRNTYSIRTHIPHWHLLLNQTEQVLRERKREPRLLLRGLKSYT